ncbi:MAG: ATP-dependent helicase [Tissierellia bacterium]|nr:ATP-dependent helicase [Tissierellia bacterium]
MKLSKEQQSAISHNNGPALVLAVPGSGKTTVLLNRAHRLIQDGAKPEKLITLSFSRSTVSTMKQRFRELPNSITTFPGFHTIHSLAYQIINSYSSLRNKRFRLIESPEIKIDKYKIIEQLFYKIHHALPTLRQKEDILLALGVIKNKAITVDEFKRQYSSSISSLSEIIEQYDKFKRQNQLIDFDDMVPFALKLLQEDAYLRRKYRNFVEYMQVDEGQDTSLVQLNLIEMLCPEKNIFIVADDDQSIYAFRGAGPEVLLSWHKDNGNMPIYYLSTNYRCPKPIVSTSNNIIKVNSERLSKPIRAFQSTGKPVKLLEFSSITEQIEYLIKDIKDCKDDSIGIIYRNNVSSIAVVEALEQHNIEFGIDPQKIELLNHWITEDILAFFHLAYNPMDNRTFSKIYYKMKKYISRKHIDWLNGVHITNSVFDSLKEYPSLPNYYFQRLGDMKKDFMSITKLPPAQAMELILKNLDYEDYVKERCLRDGLSVNFHEHLLNLLRTVADSSKSYPLFLGRLEYLESVISNSNRNTSAKVQLTTTHGSKGLEYDRVYVIDVALGQFPMQDTKDIEEERRLFYVAMTRAKKELSIIYPKSLGSISPFFQELLDLYRQK